MALEDAFKKLGDALDDLSSLETFTYRGDIEAIVKTSGEDGFRAALDEARTEGKLHLLLFTRLVADGDSVNIHGTGGVDQSLIDAHKAAFDMGRSIRQGYLELFKDIALDIIRRPTPAE